MSCQFLITRTFSLVKKVGQKGHLPGKTFAEGHYENKLRSSGTACSMRSFTSNARVSRAERRLRAYVSPQGITVQQDISFVVVTPFAYTPVYATYHMHTSVGPNALRDILGLGRRKSGDMQGDAAMKEVTNAIDKLSEDPLLQYARLEPKLAVPHTVTAATAATADKEQVLDTSETLLSYVRLAQAEAAVKTPMTGTIGSDVHDDDLKALDGFASLGDRKDE